MWRIYFSFIVFMAAFSAVQANEPDFKDYPAKIYTGKHHAAVITAENRNFRTRIKALAKNPVNFAGHYAVTWVGCGADCIFMIALDLKTGKELQGKYPPALTSCWKGEELVDKDIYFEASSRLMVVFGREADGDEEGGECLTRYYLEDKGMLQLLKQVPLGQQQ